MPGAGELGPRSRPPRRRRNSDPAPRQIPQAARPASTRARQRRQPHRWPRRACPSPQPHHRSMTPGPGAVCGPRARRTWDPAGVAVRVVPGGPAHQAQVRGPGLARCAARRPGGHAGPGRDARDRADRQPAGVPPFTARAVRRRRRAAGRTRRSGIRRSPGQCAALRPGRRRPCRRCAGPASASRRTERGSSGTRRRGRLGCSTGMAVELVRSTRLFAGARMLTPPGLGSLILTPGACLSMTRTGHCSG
jgi:hypothetical protein